MSNKPKIRFTGFTYAWEQRKLSDMVDRVTRKNENLESELPLTISAQYGLIDQNEFFDKRIASRDVSGYYLLKKGEFAYNKSTSSDAPWGAVKRLDRYEMGVLSTLYIVFALKENGNIDSDFLVSYYDTDCWHKGVQAIAAEGARNHGLLNITPADYFETVLTVPSDTKEQHQIGTFFSKLDTLITLHQRKCDTLQKFKKSMLQKMFPQNGESVPEIRFAGFTDAWEQRKLEEICEQVKETVDPQLTPNTKFYEYSMPAFDDNSRADIVSGYDMNSIRKVINAPCLLINKLNVRKKRIWLVEKPEKNAVCSAEFVPVTSGVSDLSFLKYTTLKDDFTAYLEDCSSGSSNSQKRVTPDVIMKATIQIPTIAEQSIIGTFFSNLDSLITLHQRKLETLQKTKKSMLQKMFV